MIATIHSAAAEFGPSFVAQQLVGTALVLGMLWIALTGAAVLL